MISAVAADASHVPPGKRLQAERAGQEFESVLLNMVLGAVERSFAQLPGDKFDHSTEAYSGMAMQSLAAGLAKAGGIGLAKFITAGLIKNEPGGQP